MAVSIIPCPPPLADPHPPAQRPPAGACDSHCHIFGPFERFPPPDDRSFTPSEAPETALRALHDRMGFSRAVIVQSQGHGLDHRPLLDALAHAPDRYRGVALVRPATTDADIRSFDAAGICGTRFSFLSHLGGTPDLEAVAATAKRVAPLGWHTAIHVAGTDIATYADFIATLPTPVIIDHMARPDIAADLAPIREALFRLIDTGRVWVKLSGADRLSKAGSPYADVSGYARALLNHAPERMLWGSDWPHVNLSAAMPNDGTLVDWIDTVATTTAIKYLLMVKNPAEVFRYPASSNEASRD
ncbi:2-pyrone-4,6-dicarboxylate hydrolase [Azorhizobium oxalatiphilum]|uniref:2-pyrone-4,6-dicarboxylate hydrolase n=1 Tax=Azorhizobium oxalatiphilum TaxID=980631 RepID=A0A917BUC9_9HYPH|nr:amidohydrolase family protein [Azorhizobium oxalatiphilum]GGF57128.1 2-pyrone-4,6-dicarboxylate hydrolase [Azorhizobium oxalatiphilum]